MSPPLGIYTDAGDKEQSAGVSTERGEGLGPWGVRFRRVDAGVCGGTPCVRFWTTGSWIIMSA